MLKRVAGALAVAMFCQASSAQLTIIEQFNVNVGTLVGLAFDASRGRVWLHPGFGANILRYTRGGTADGTVPRPGESANDFDISFASSAFTLGANAVPANSLLVFNGESGTADVYAVDPGTGLVISSLATAFGTNHVVGGAYHAQRNTLFLVQDRNGAAGQGNRIAEINPTTGAVLNSFVTGADFTVNFGDLEVNQVSGNLFIVSSDEAFIREFSPTGVLIADYALPAGVSGLSGLGFDGPRGEAWVTNTGGTEFRLGGLGPGPCLGDANSDGTVNFADITSVLANFGMNYGDGTGPGDANLGGLVNFADITAVLANFGTVCATIL